MSSVCLSVFLSVTLRIVALTVGVDHRCKKNVEIKIRKRQKRKKRNKNKKRL